MRSISFLSEAIFVGRSSKRGRGVFAREKIEKGTVIEVSPVVVMSHEDRLHIDKTLLHDYIFEWGDDHAQCCMALGYIPLYNHSYESNCEYEMSFSRQIISIKTVRDIKRGEELTINYNGEWNNAKPVWFDVK
ncbi:MAG TPA: SET domain-containing protein [Flavisolibacter sp.]